MLNIVFIILLLFWTGFCLTNIFKNMNHYSFLDWIIILIITLNPIIIYLFILKHQKAASKSNSSKQTAVTHIDENCTLDPPSEKLQDRNTTYIQTTNKILRADGKPISDEEVPYLIEIGYRQAVGANEQARTALSEEDEELQFKFMMNHGAESQKYCDKFKNLNRLAFEETNIDKKIKLLQQTIEAFEAAKQWHYKCSKGAKQYFQEFYEQLHNSRNNCFSLVDSVKDELEFQIHKRDFIIPWIIKNAKTGFLQTQIYKEFPENGKGELRRVIDELVQNSVIIKIKKGNSYFISQK